MSDVERRFVPVRELRATPSGGIAGLGIVYESLSHDLGGFVERILPGASTKALKRSDVLGTFNHDFNIVLGRQSNGTLRLRETAKGVEYETDPQVTVAGKDVAALVQRGDIIGSSFGFTVAKNGDRWSTMKDGRQLREIFEFNELFDIGPVASAAYAATTVSARARRHLAQADELPPAPTHRGSGLTDEDRKRIMRELEAEGVLSAPAPVSGPRFSSAGLSHAQLRAELSRINASLWKSSSSSSVPPVARRTAPAPRAFGTHGTRARRVGYHEAGHAVVMEHQGTRVSLIQLFALDGGGIRGIVRYEGYLDDVRNVPAAGFLAGAAAMALYDSGRLPFTDDEVRELVKKSSPEDLDLFWRARRENGRDGQPLAQFRLAVKILEQSWRAVEALTDRLMEVEGGRLEGEEVRRIIRLNPPRRRW